MFWTLLLAHLLADYPLQSAAMVRAKRTWSGLSLHVSIHLAAMLVLSWPAIAALWPQLLALAGLHFAIDSLKNLLARRRPAWVVGPYLWDQVLHLLSIALVALWIRQSIAHADPWLSSTWAIVGSGYLLATQVWAISERVLAYAEPAYLAQVQAHYWPRLAIRGGLLTLVLVAVLESGLWSAGRPGALVSAGLLVWPYVSGPLGRRALLTDVAAVLASALFVVVALWVR